MKLPKAQSVSSLAKTLLSMKRRYLVLGGLFLVFIIFLVARRGTPSTPHFAPVQKEDLKQQVSASGVLTGKDSANLHFKTSGKLAYINVKAGDSVWAGEVLAGLDTPDLNNNLSQAQNNLRAAQVNLEKVLDDIHLFQYGNGGFANVGSPNETETQKQARMDAEVVRDNAVQSVAAAQAAFSDASITSPFSGIVTQADPKPGVVVSTADDIVKIVDFSQPTFASDIDESDVAKVLVGQLAEVTLNAYGDKVFSGSVSEVLHETRTTSAGATVVTVKVALKDKSIKTIQGLNGQVNIITAQKTGLLAIPQSALLTADSVLVKTRLGLEQRKISTGFQNDTDIQVTSGLTEGDQVVTNPSEVQKTLGQQGFLSRLLRKS